MSQPEVQNLNGYRFIAKDAFLQGGGIIDGDVLRPDEIGKLTPKEVQELLIRQGRERLPLKELFEIEELDSKGVLEIPGSPRFKTLGMKMEAGQLVVHGHGGGFLGQEMKGGEILVQGDAGSHVGASMISGSIRIEGSVGDRAGAPSGSNKYGQNGGKIIIEGDAGDETGFNMRRGLLAVKGECGKVPGYGLLAGTIYIGKGRPTLPGLGMVRGTILIGDKDAQADPEADWPGAHTNDGGLFTANFLRLLYRMLDQEGCLEEKPEVIAGQAHRFYSGDHLPKKPGQPMGRGEIIVRVK